LSVSDELAKIRLALEEAQLYGKGGVFVLNG
jgi:hypothetical protein